MKNPIGTLGLLLLIALPSHTQGQQKPNVTLTGVKSHDKTTTLMYVKNLGSRPVMVTVKAVTYERGSLIGETLKDYLVPPLRKQFVGGTDSRSGSARSRTRYSVVNAYFK